MDRSLSQVSNSIDSSGVLVKDKIDFFVCLIIAFFVFAGLHKILAKSKVPKLLDLDVFILIILSALIVGTALKRCYDDTRKPNPGDRGSEQITKFKIFSEKNIAPLLKELNSQTFKPAESKVEIHKLLAYIKLSKIP